MTVGNKWFLLFAGLLSAVLVLGAACGGDDDDDDTGGDDTPAAGQTEPAGDDMAPADEQKITIQFVEPQFIDPQKSNFEQDIGILRMLNRGLYNLTDDGAGGVKVEPMLAAGDPTVSGSVYTVKLRDGIKWSDGQAITAGDFVYGIQRACDPTVASPYQYLLGAGIGYVTGCDALAKNTDAAQTAALTAAIGARAVDDTTLEVTLDQPIATFTTIFALWTTFPARKDVIEANGDQWTAPATIVTSGPYTLSEHVAGDHLTLVPNTSWTGDIKPALQEITVKFLDDLPAAFQGFKTGELWMTEIEATNVAVAEGDSALKDSLLVVPTARITAIEVQMEDEALSNFDLRLALSRSIDREQLNDVVYDGVFKPATYWVVEGIKGHQGNAAFDDKIGFNLEEAKAALQRYTDAGNALPELRYTTRDTPQRRNEFDVLAKTWKDELGITVTAEFVDSQTRSQRFNAEDFDLFPGGWQLDYPDIENPLVGLFDTGGGNNHYNCSDPDVDAAFAEAAAATNEEDRIAAYQKVETNIIEKLCGIIPIYQDSRPFLVNTRLGGVLANGTIDAGSPGNYCPECWYVKKQ